MLNADSSTLKNPSAAQMRPMPPMTESSVACSWISVTASRMFSTEFSGNARSSSSTRRLDSSCSPANARSESARKRSGTKARIAKYAIIAARCVPRSARNLRMMACTEGRESTVVC